MTWDKGQRTQGGGCIWMFYKKDCCVEILVGGPCYHEELRSLPQTHDMQNFRWK